MIDDFVANPHELRRQALALGYDPAFKQGNYPGLTSVRPLAIPGLDDYVSRPDTNYSYHLVSTIPGQGQTTFIVEMTSQAWLTTNEVDRPLWKHWLLVVKPDSVTSAKSLLFISGGANDGKVPKSADANLAKRNDIAIVHRLMIELQARIGARDDPCSGQ